MVLCALAHSDPPRSFLVEQGDDVGETQEQQVNFFDVECIEEKCVQ